MENKREKTMTATMMPKATEQLTNHTLRLTFNRLGSRVTVVRKSMKGVPRFNKAKLARMTKEQKSGSPRKQLTATSLKGQNSVRGWILFGSLRQCQSNKAYSFSTCPALAKKSWKGLCGCLNRKRQDVCQSNRRS